MKSKTKSNSDVLKLLGRSFKFYELDGDVIDVKGLTKISEEDIDVEAEELPALLQYFGRLQAKALRRLRNAETDYKIWYAGADRRMRDKKVTSGKKFTEKEVENGIIISPEYEEKKKHCHKTEEEYEIIKSLYWTIQKKADIIEEIMRQKATYSKLTNKKYNKET